MWIVMNYPLISQSTHQFYNIFVEKNMWLFVQAGANKRHFGMTVGWWKDRKGLIKKRLIFDVSNIARGMINATLMEQTQTPVLSKKIS